MKITKTLAALLVLLLWGDVATARDAISINGVKVETLMGTARPHGPAVVILSGSKGFGSPAYHEIALLFSQNGIDVYLAHLLTDDDVLNIASLKNASQRIDYYEKRRSSWSASTVKLLSALAERPQYRGRVALLGISLGAETAAFAVALGADANALVLVDGGASENVPLGKLPPTQVVWGKRDTVFPLAEAQRFVKRVAKSGGKVALSVFEGGHDFFLKPETKQAVEAYETTIRFLQNSTAE